VNNHRKYSLAAGILYLITFISIPTLALYTHAHDLNFITGAGPDSPIILGGILEIIVALAGIGTAVALYMVVKRQNGAVALGFVGSRTLEASTIFGGVACLFSLVTLRQAGVGAGGVVTGQALAAMYDRFFLGQNLMPVVNALLLGYLMYKSRLVPRFLPILGFIGAPLLLAATIIGLFSDGMKASGVLTLAFLPIAAWELLLGIWLTFKGFNKSAITTLSQKTGTD
jgi:hypothetical protein